jgi:hypothetical protein
MALSPRLALEAEQIEEMVQLPRLFMKHGIACGQVLSTCTKIDSRNRRFGSCIYVTATRFPKRN